MVGGLVGFWCCRPWLEPSVFNFGQLIVLMATWKVASLLCMTPRDWSRMTRLRLLAYCVWIGMQPRQFLVGQKTAADAPSTDGRRVPPQRADRADPALGGPRLLPASTPGSSGFWIALVAFGFLFLVARLDFWALIFRAMGFAVEKLWDCPVAATSLGDFWGRRWNRIVPGFLREVVFMPLARRVGPKLALLAVFLYSGLYHEGVQLPGGVGIRRPDALLPDPVRRGDGREQPRRPPGLRDHPWLGRAWTAAVLILPVGLFLHRGLVDDCLVPMLTATGVQTSGDEPTRRGSCPSRAASSAVIWVTEVNRDGGRQRRFR